MEIWTDAFINNANIMIDRHHLLAGYSLSYMSIIRGAVIDAHLKRVFKIITWLLRRNWKLSCCRASIT
jgi:hypothetical protein